MRPVLSAACRRKAMERSRGAVTPPHSAGMYFLFGFIWFVILVASWCSRRLSPVYRLAQPQSLALVVVCCMLCVYVTMCGGAVRCCRSRALFPTYVSIDCACSGLRLLFGCFWLLMHDRCVAVGCVSVVLASVALAFGCSYFRLAFGCFTLLAVLVVCLFAVCLAHISYTLL